MIYNNSQDSEKLPPHNLDAEKGFLGILLLDGSKIYDILPIVKPDDFYADQNKWIFESCLSLVGRGESINQITIARELASKNRLEDIGGAAYLSHLIGSNATEDIFFTLPSVARVIKNCSISRKAISMSFKIAAMGYTESDPIKLVSDIEKLTLNLQKEVALPKLMTPEDWAQKGVEYYGLLQQGKRQGVYTGFKQLDDVMGGIFGGELCYLAARPSHGKTDLSLSIAEHVGKNFGNVLLASLEQPWAEILDRFTARDLNISPRHLRAGCYNTDLMEKIYNSVSTIAEKNLYFYDSGGDIEGHGSSVDSIFSIANHMQLAYGLRLVIIDYLGLMEDTGRDKIYERISAISKKLKRMARILDVPVICLCQLNRQPDIRLDHHPILPDLRETGAIEADGDIILFCYRPEKYTDILEAAMNKGINIQGINEIILGKHRQLGEMAGSIVPLIWNANHRCYKDAVECGVELHMDSELHDWYYKDLPIEFKVHKYE